MYCDVCKGNQGVCSECLAEVIKEFRECVQLNRNAADSCGEMLTRHKDPSGEYYTGKAAGMDRAMGIFNHKFENICKEYYNAD